uniref:Mannosyltransferase n=1 Tax=Heterorhabditis bacteriophora TaxID=37862 RepID=A0A1I7X184_HETBA
MLFLRPKHTMFFYFCAISAIVVGGSLLSVDSYYYGKRVFVSSIYYLNCSCKVSSNIRSQAPLNIVLYNIFSSHGAQLYGVEPLSFYIKNIFLNWNLASLLAPLGMPSSIKTNFKSLITFFKHNYNLYLKLFLLVILNLINYRLVSRFIPSLSMLSWCVIVTFALISFSRTFSLHRNFGAHIEVYRDLFLICI